MLVDDLPSAAVAREDMAAPAFNHVARPAAAATDKQIDRLVYDLYGLKAEEIALVEGQV